MLTKHFRGAPDSLDVSEVLKDLGFVNTDMNFHNREGVKIDLNEIDLLSSVK
jgi:hypothetical protein